MAASLIDLPIPVAADILAHLSDLRDLASAIRSQRLFHAALQHHRIHIVSGVLRNRIPRRTLPFAEALYKSPLIDRRDKMEVYMLLKWLSKAVRNPALSLGVLSRLPMAQVAAVLETHACVEQLAREFMRSSIPLYNLIFACDHPVAASEAEVTRLFRAIYRFQLMCNLFCCVASPLSNSKRRRWFWGAFSPWVNDQVLCVYGFVQAKVIEAFDELASHDVQYGSVPIDWTPSAHFIPPAQEAMCQGLDFLVRLCRARDYDSRVKLMPVTLFQAWGQDRHPLKQLFNNRLTSSRLDKLQAHRDTTLESLEDDQREDLATPLDGRYDRIDSDPAYMWFAAHGSRTMLALVEPFSDINLWLCGYVLWDGAPLTRAVGSRVAQFARGVQNHTNRVRWPLHEVSRSQRERAVIYRQGGTGYWPRGGRDFGRIVGLSEEKIEKLTREFEASDT